MQSTSWFVLLCLIAFLNLFFFRSVGVFGIQLALLGVWVFVATLGVLRGEFSKKAVLFSASGTVLLALTLFTLLRANPTIQFLLFLSSAFTVLLTLYSVVSTHPHFIALMEVVSIPLLMLKSYLTGAQDLLKGHPHLPAEQGINLTHHAEAYWKRFRPIIVGLLVAAPVMFILVALFSQADPVFESFVKNIVGQNFLENMVWRAVMSLILLALGLPVLLMKQKEQFSNPLNQVNRWHLVTEYSVVMGAVALVIGVFLAIQWRYIFIPAVSGVDLSKYGVQTYSEYVTKGFSQLLVASIFIFGLIWTGLILMRNKAASQIMVLKSLQFVVLTEFLVLLGSVFRRIWLYQHFQGMSLVRFYGGYFVLFLLMMSITLFLRHIIKFRFVIVELMIVVGSVIGLALFNVEQYIAVSHPPTVNDRVDYVYLSRMSPDGIDGWEKSFDWSKGILEASYPEGSTINAEQRQQIAYAGITLEQLLSRYQQMVRGTDDPEEVRAYYRQTLSYLQQELISTTNNLNTVGPKLLLNAKEETTAQSYQKTFTELQNQLSNNQNDLQQKAAYIEGDTFNPRLDLVRSYTPLNNYYTGSNRKVNLYNINCAYWGVCSSETYGGYPNSFFSSYSSVPTDGEKHNVVLLDKVFTWHPGQTATYNRMKRSIKLDELLSLQKKYFELVNRVSLQTDNERDYDADISFDTPFLQSL